MLLIVAALSLAQMQGHVGQIGLDHLKLARAKPDAIVMHPGPMNRGVEIDALVADDPERSVIGEQVEMGVAVRMAVLELLAEAQGAAA